MEGKLQFHLVIELCNVLQTAKKKKIAKNKSVQMNCQMAESLATRESWLKVRYRFLVHALKIHAKLYLSALSKAMTTGSLD